MACLSGWEQKDTSVSNKILSKIKRISLIISTQILRYVIGIAGTMSEEQDVTDSVIIQISNWMSKYDAKEDNST
ncbi:MAG: hypothetical protein WCE92_05925 [Nitrososphaeraceae archaeon]